MTPGAPGARGYDLVVFSPHLDDAALSCGGRIAAAVRSGASVLVVTAFSGAPDREGRRSSVGSLAAFAGMEARRAEDEVAMARLGADRMDLGHEEAIGRDARYRSFLSLMGAIRRSDAALPRALEDVAHGLCGRNPRALLLFPLGVGGHVDHRILFEVSRRLLARGVAPGRMAWFEEIPYAFVPFLLEHRLAQSGARLPSSARPPDFARTGSILATSRRAVDGVISVPIIRSEIRPLQEGLLRVIMTVLVARRRLQASLPGRSGSMILRPDLMDVTEEESTKEDAVVAYRSQLPALFGSADAWRRAARAYAERIDTEPCRHLERYWVCAGVPEAGGAA